MSLLLLFRPSAGGAVGVSLPNAFVMVPALARSVVIPLVASVAIPTVAVSVKPPANPPVIVPTLPREVRG